ncbi:MAG: tandem-95 repeat protein [Thermoplasmata archaeon]|nr:MAG: tandem-95 repeat protein [Thermoplasmata archaeon]
MTATAEPITIDTFKGGVDEATLTFTESLLNASLALEMPPGSTIVSASVTIEGVGGQGAESSFLNFTNGELDTDVFAHWNEGRGLYPPSVDPRNHRWNSIANLEVILIAKDDSIHWQTDTRDQLAGQPPGSWPIQLYRFIPNTLGADNVTVTWNGWSACAFNRTNPYHAEMWLYDHSDSAWEEVADYDQDTINDTWINYTIDLPSSYVDTDGSIDVAMVGLPSQWAGPMLPAYDEGHLATDFIGIEVVSKGGIQYPTDVALYIDDTEVTSLTGELTTPLTIDDTFGFADSLQAILDEHPVTPDNVTLGVTFALGSPSAGQLTVRDLVIEYDPPVNEAPTYGGPDTFHLVEDGGRQEVMDLDTLFDDDYNKGLLEFSIEDVDDSQFPNSMLISVGTGTGGNTTLFVTPEVDFFGGPVNVTLRAVDTFDAHVTAVVSLMVDQVGDRPVLAAGGSMEAFENTPFHHVFTVEDVDLPDDSFTFSDSSDMFDVDPETGVLDWTPASNQIGEHRFGVTVTDRFGLEDTQVYTIDVKNSNDPPVIISGLTHSAVEDTETVYTIRAEDPDVPFGDTLSYFAFADGVDIDVDQATGRLTFTPANAQVPSFDILIRVQDAIGITAEEVLVVDVENVNDPPVFEDPTELVYDQGEDVAYRLKVVDPDALVELPVPETLTYSGLGPDFLMPDSEGMIAFTADQSMVGDHEATYTVTDSAGAQDVITITWTINNVNDAPVISTSLADEVPEDELVNITMEATDLDGDIISWSVNTDLFTIGQFTGTFTWMPAQADVGSHLITFTASDGKGGDAMLTWDMEVLNVNDDPVIDTFGPEDGGSYDEGKGIEFTATASDEDGDFLTYTWKRGNKVLGTGAVLTVDDLEPGEHTVTLLVEDGNGGEATRQVKVEVTSSGMATSTLMWLLLVVVIVVIVGTVVYMRQRYSAPPPEPEPEPEPEEEADGDEDEPDEDMAPEEEGDEEGEPDEDVTPVVVQCPSCDTYNNVTTSQRPYEFRCEKCNALLRLKD